MQQSDMQYESARLDSFERWPVSFISLMSLASAGFYYLHTSDRIRCAFCGVEITRWDEGDDPRVEHATHAPLCRFVRNMPCGNVRIERLADFGIQCRDGEDESKLISFGVCKNVIPSFPEFADETTRFNSFRK